MGDEVMTIGTAAQAAGVTTRTLRYYEQLGLLDPAERSPGGSRRYRLADVARVGRIRQLQDILGQDLAQIATVLAAEDRLEVLRAAYVSGDRRDQRRVLQEAILINDRLRAQVAQRRAALEVFAAELETKATRYRAEATRLAGDTAATAKRSTRRA
jgi:DNA-binding transcriptional MerR regulator